MQRDLKVYLWDLQKALGEIETFTKGKDLRAYRTERMLQAAVERNFITVGEVLSRILHHVPESKARIDHARKIANFRAWFMNSPLLKTQKSGASSRNLYRPSSIRCSPGSLSLTLNNPERSSRQAG